MKSINFPSTFRAALALAAITFSLAVCAQAQIENELYTFNLPAGGQYPFGTLVFDGSGNLYGTTVDGGNSTGTGTVYKLSPTSTAHWKRTLLHAFGGPGDGKYPESGLAMDAAGNLYGITTAGGISTDCVEFGGCGVVFKLSPTSSGLYKETILHSFTGGADGFQPEPDSSLVLDSAGNVYGTVGFGGIATACAKVTTNKGCGVVFQLSPNSTGGWKYTILRAFTGLNGAYPSGSVTFDSSGNLYGTTLYGGTGTCTSQGCGVVYELSPTSTPPWTETVLYNFTGNADGAFPLGSMVRDSSGNLYGVTQRGANNLGNVFEISPGSTGSWSETTLYNFAGESDGSDPTAPLLADSTGNFYGMTTLGGSSNCGTLYELQNSSLGWSESILHTFTCLADGGIPVGGLIFDDLGRLYGTASNDNGTAPNTGVVFQFNP